MFFFVQWNYVLCAQLHTCMWVQYGQNVRWCILSEATTLKFDRSVDDSFVFVCECMGICLRVRNILSTRQNSNWKMQNKHSQRETMRTGKCEQIKLNEKVNEKQQQKMEQILRHDTNISIRTLKHSHYGRIRRALKFNIKPHFRPELITLIERQGPKIDHI